jgi:hypothetical protein
MIGTRRGNVFPFTPLSHNIPTPETTPWNSIMSKLKYTGVLAILLASTAALAGEDMVEMERPSLHTSNKVVVTSVVEAINHETREVTLKGEDGELVTFTASEEARNLGQVDVGDIVTAEYLQSITIDVRPNDGTEPGVGEVTAMGRTDEGEMPGIVAMESQVSTAILHEINLETNSFKLREADGRINEYAARDPENLKRVVVGDLVIITYTEAVAISVEEKPAE